MTTVHRIQASRLAEQLLGFSEIKRRKKRQKRRRHLETLERRELLAADSAWPFIAFELDEAHVETAADTGHAESELADINDDQIVSAGDGLLLVNAINHILSAGHADLLNDPGNYLESGRFDISGDGQLGEEDYLVFLAAVNHKSWELSPSTAATDAPISEDQPDDPNGQGSGGSSSGNDDSSGAEPPGGSGGSGGSGSGGGSGNGSGDSGSGSGSGGGGSSGGSGSGGSSGTGSAGADDPADSGSGGSGGSQSNDDSTGSSGPACDHRLSDKTVNEAEIFDLPLTLDDNCLMDFQVAWGDGHSQTYEAGDTPRHMYDDDDPTNTPSDRYDVVVTIDKPNGGTTTLEGVITVNNVAPIAFHDDATTTEDQTVTIRVLDNDRDPSYSDDATLTLSDIDTTGTVGTVTQQSRGVFVYDPRGKFDCLAEGETATDSFRYSIHDDDEPTKKSTATVTIVVQGRREQYLLSYGAAGQGQEDSPQPVPLDFSITPQATCKPVEVTYRRTDYSGAANLAAASDADVVDPVGTVRFAEGQSSTRATMTPVDDKLIEQNEWLFFSVDATKNGDYEIIPAASQRFFKIEDNEWRFVSGTKSESGQFGPIIVEAFSKYGVSSVLSGNYSLNGSLNANLGSSVDSTARVRADNAAILTRPGSTNNQAGDFAQITFHCDSQTGDIWRDWVLSGGTNNDAPLSTTVGMEYQVNDIGDEKAIAVVDVSFEFLAGGTISKSFSPGLELQLGDRSKAQTGGSIRLQKQVTYSGGASHRVGDGFTLRCERGPKD